MKILLELTEKNKTTEQYFSIFNCLIQCIVRWVYC